MRDELFISDDALDQQLMKRRAVLGSLENCTDHGPDSKLTCDVTS